MYLYTCNIKIFLHYIYLFILNSSCPKPEKMRRLGIIAAALLAILQSGCASDNTEVVINGQFPGEIPSRIFYNVPVNGTSFEGFNREVKPDSLGRFQIVFKTGQPVLISFNYFDSPSLIAEPGQHYEITLNRNEDRTVGIGGNLSEAQQVYSALPHHHPRSCLYFLEEDINDYITSRKILHAELEKELALFEKLRERNRISTDVYYLLVTDRTIYYALAQSSLISQNHLRMRINNEEVPDEIFDLWAEAAFAVLMENRFFMSSVYSWDLLQLTLFYHAYTGFDYDEFVALRAEKRAAQATHAHDIEMAKIFFTGPVLEFFTAGTFRHYHGRKMYDKNMASILEDFKSDFPESNYLPFVEATLEEMLIRQKTLATTE
jgi:hypothetical protein